MVESLVESLVEDSQEVMAMAVVVAPTATAAFA